MGGCGLYSCEWMGTIFLSASKNRPIDPIVSTLVRLSFPVAIVGSYYPVGLYLTLATNVATYALVDLGVEILLRHLGTQTSS